MTTPAATDPAPALGRPHVDRGRLSVVALGAGLVAMSGPGQTAGFSVFVDPITESFGVSRGQLTTAYLVATLLAAPTGLWLGRHLDGRRLGTMIRVVGVCLALALVITASSPGLPVLTFGVFGLRAFGQTGFTLTASVFVARAVTVRRGAALGWLSALGGLAISMTPLLASRLIPLIGWRQTWLLLAAVVLTGSLLLAAAAGRLDGLGRRRRSVAGADASALLDPLADPDADPDADVHADPDADVPVPVAEVVAGPAVVPEPLTTEQTGSTDPRERRWAFAVVTACVATMGAIGTALGFHQIAVLGERGLSATEAAANFVPQSAAAAVFAVLVGRQVDRLPGRLVVPGVMVLALAALGAIHLVSSPVTGVLFGVMLGGSVAANHASEGALLARWTGTVTLGRLRGRMMAVAVASTAVAPLWFTLLADALGSFSRAVTATMLLPLTVGVIAWFAPLPADPTPDPVPTADVGGSTG